MASGGSGPSNDCPPSLSVEVGHSCVSTESSDTSNAGSAIVESTAANRLSKPSSIPHPVRNPKTSLSTTGSVTSNMSNAPETNAASKTVSSTEAAHVPALPAAQPPKSRRKSTPRAKKDADEAKNRIAAQASSTLSISQNVLPQGPLMLTSAPAGQFMLVHHNGQCFMMPAAQYFSTNQQMAAARPHAAPPTTSAMPSASHEYLKAVHHHQHTAAAIAAQHLHVQQQQQHQQAQPQQQQQQQQFVRSSIVSGSATLGQLARSLAPKPAPSGGASSCSSQCSTPTSLTFQAVPTSNVNQPSGSAATNIAHMSGQIVGTMPTMGQQPVFQQGIQIRATAPGSSSGIVLQMPNGAYTYVQQVVAPQQPSSVSLSHHQPMSAVMNQSASHQQPQQHTHVHHTRAHTPQPSEHTNIQHEAVAQSANKHTSDAVATTADYVCGNKHNETVASTQNFMSVLGSPSACGVPLNIADSPPKAAFRGGGAGSKQSNASKAKSTNSASKVHVPPTIAPSNLVPIGAPMPMMVMSTAMPQMGTFAGPAVPVMGANGQIIHQQLIPAAPMPAHQMIPVFQQQQNVSKFAGSQAQQTPQQAAVPEDANAPSSSPRKRTGEEGTTVDSGGENEPPPLLVQGECKDALDVRVLFMKEADRYYRKAGRKGRIIHLIEGFEIEESDEPFICDPPLRVDDWIPVEIIDKIRLSKSPESPSKRTATPSTNTDAQSPNEKKGKVETPPKAAKDIPKKQKNKTPVGKDENRDSRSSSEKKKRKRKTNELDRLLQMDFGPAQGRLCDMLGTPTAEKAKEKKAKEPLNKEVDKACEEVKQEKIGKDEEKKEVERQERESSKQEEEKSMVTTDARLEESNIPVADVSLNSSKGSSLDQGLGLNVGTSFSDEELDTERCNYCNGLLRLKRCDNHPQYCSKKCRKLWKKNAAVAEEQGAKPLNGSPRQPNSGLTTASSSPSKDLPSMPIAGLQRSLSTPNTFPSTPLVVSSGAEVQQRSPPTLTLKMVSPQQAEIVKSPRTSAETAPSASVSAPYQHSVPTVETVVPPLEKPPLDFLQKPARTWTCDEVAKWVASVTGSEDCGGTFRNQDIDGQSLLLLAENPHHNLGTLLGLKLGPVVKIQNALRELAAKSINAA